ncbi:DUF4186 domain-containing protein [Zymomonas mobilis]|uniref:DUF4186 domain-containing protein n=1 Tax=Zymomonas mobilis TaxID=542 RepID=UPI0003C777F5|nr:DUF4186 domain-containing protein [Zymomonas mobilis]AHB09635.1 protein of unknown function (DUF4186) [Zymomonas mobilis subsp. mobilis str. CP4 = NRRL B-14023]AHJ69940.1 hypothetical protein A254_00307 [Zymomonas mobilis subsp. mobilis NRRL B-12526]AHJ71795.1 hypothetical protein A265_00307 [Zymomonas mobilis subsp. mobilis str. CP4 = NRRL B-14023]TWE24342.1 uncharacterized protein DUF4186 [Zymomonas mobilis]
MSFGLPAFLFLGIKECRCYYSEMANLDVLFERLSRSSFRRRFRLGVQEQQYLANKGMETILEHGKDFIAQRLAPAEIPNDGKQTPYKGHPVFLAQHATGTCCRGCIEKWHRIEAGKSLSQEEQAYILDVIAHWLDLQKEVPPKKTKAATPSLLKKRKSKAEDVQGSLFPEIEK